MQFKLTLLGFYFFAEVAVAASPYKCDPGGNMRELEACAIDELLNSSDVLEEYLAATFKYLPESASSDLYPGLVLAISDSHMKWKKYSESVCKAEQLTYGMGTMSYYSKLRCETRFNRNRALYLWKTHLQPGPATSYREPPLVKPVFKKIL